MASNLYEQDFLLWSEHQADLLERLAAGERVNERVDWPNLVEEVRDLGGSELRACTSWLLQTCMHLLKLSVSPESMDAGHWSDEIEAFLSDLQSHYTPSMAQRIDVTVTYAKARRRFAGRNKDRLGRVPEICPFTLEDFLDDELTVADLLAKLNPPA